jgi:hypothetical protein
VAVLPGRLLDTPLHADDASVKTTGGTSEIGVTLDNVG